METTKLQLFQVICHWDEEIRYGRRWYTIKLLIWDGVCVFCSFLYYTSSGMLHFQSFCGLQKCWTLHFSNFERCKHLSTKDISASSGTKHLKNTNEAIKDFVFQKKYIFTKYQFITKNTILLCYEIKEHFSPANHNQTLAFWYN